MTDPIAMRKELMRLVNELSEKDVPEVLQMLHDQQAIPETENETRADSDTEPRWFIEVSDGTDRQIERLDATIRICEAVAERLPILHMSTNKRRCLVGFVRLARSHARMLRHAIDTNNYPGLVVLMRVILELGTKLLYVLNAGQHAEFIACNFKMQQMETLHRQLLLQRKRGGTDLSDEAVAHSAERLNAIKSELAGMEKPVEPFRYKAKSQFNIAKMGHLYETIYDIGSGYVHSDGYAIVNSVGRARVPSLADVCRLCAPIFLTAAMAIADAFEEHDWSHLDEVVPNFDDLFPELADASGKQ